MKLKEVIKIRTEINNLIIRNLTKQLFRNSSRAFCDNVSRLKGSAASVIWKRLKEQTQAYNLRSGGPERQLWEDYAPVAAGKAMLIS